MKQPITIPPRSGTAFRLEKGDSLTVIDPRGEQVSDLVAFSAADVREAISSGRSLDYASKLYLTTGDAIYSNRSNIMLRIVEDKVGRHDFLLTPCSRETFKIIYRDENPHQGCFGNLEVALAPLGVIGPAVGFGTTDVFCGSPRGPSWPTDRSDAADGRPPTVDLELPGTLGTSAIAARGEGGKCDEDRDGWCLEMHDPSSEEHETGH